MSKVQQLAKMIDHSILHPTMTDTDLKEGCAVAKKYQTASVCVKPYMVKEAAALLQGSGVLVGCVIGFPAGNSAIDVKVFETENACKDGAVEIDMVINIGKALQGDWDYVEREIRAVTSASHKNGAVVKVIFETDYITDEGDLKRLCDICVKVSADYVKTSTGFGFVKDSSGMFTYTGATIHNLKLMKQAVGDRAKVKASGGVRTLDMLLQVQEAGCARCGATATEQLLEEARQRFGE
jgi:deoxyribose-phosphate aldolase